MGDAEVLPDGETDTAVMADLANNGLSYPTRAISTAPVPHMISKHLPMRTHPEARAVVSDTAGRQHAPEREAALCGRGRFIPESADADRIALRSNTNERVSGT